MYICSIILATDINQAVTEGAKMLNAHPREGSASILILLTDGDPTSGYNKTHKHSSSVSSKSISWKFDCHWVDCSPLLSAS